MPQRSKMLADMIDCESFNEQFKNRLRDLYVYGYKSYRDVIIEESAKGGRVIPKNTFSESVSRISAILSAHIQTGALSNDKKLSIPFSESLDLQNVNLSDVNGNIFFALYRYCFQDMDFATWFISLILLLSPKVSVNTEPVRKFVSKYLENEGFCGQCTDHVKQQLVDSALKEVLKSGTPDAKTSLLLMKAKGVTLNHDMKAVASEKMPSQKSLWQIMYECGFVKFSDNNKKLKKLEPMQIISVHKTGRDKHLKLSCESLSEMITHLTAGYSEEEKAFFKMRLKEFLRFFSGCMPLGEIGWYAMKRTAKDEDSIIKLRRNNIKRALCDYNIADILNAMENEKWLYVTYRNAVEKGSYEFVVYPISLRESTHDGRQYLIAYSPRAQSVLSLRIQFIDRLQSGDITMTDDMRMDIERAKRAYSFLWGHSFPQFSGGNVVSDMPVHDVYLRIRKCDNTACDFLSDYAHRGSLTDTDEYCEFRCKVLNYDELLPWLRLMQTGIEEYMIDGVSRMDFLAQDAELGELRKIPYAAETEKKTKNCKVALVTCRDSFASKHFEKRTRWKKSSESNNVVFERIGTYDAIRREICAFANEFGNGGIVYLTVEIDRQKERVTLNELRARDSECDFDFLYVDADITTQTDSVADRAFSEIKTLKRTMLQGGKGVLYHGAVMYGDLVKRIMRSGDGVYSLKVNGAERNLDLTKKEEKNTESNDKKPENFSLCNTHELLFNDIFGCGYACICTLTHYILKHGKICKKLKCTREEIDRVFAEANLQDFSAEKPKDDTDCDIMRHAMDVLAKYGVDTGSTRGRGYLARSLREIADFIKAIGNYDERTEKFAPLLCVADDSEFFTDFIPLTLSERTWLYNVLCDYRAAIFLTESEVEKIKNALRINVQGESKPPFDISRMHFYDRKPNPQKSREYQTVMKLLRAVYAEKYIRITVNEGEGTRILYIAPYSLEYMNTTDTFSLCAVELGHKLQGTKRTNPEKLKEYAAQWMKDAFVRVEVAAITDIEEDEIEFDRQSVRRLMSAVREISRKRMVLKFKDTRNVPDRLLTELSAWHKTCVREKTGLAGIYTAEIFYNADDEEIIKGIVKSYGAYVYVCEG